MVYKDKKLKEYNDREERFRLAVEEAKTNRSASINSLATKFKVSRTTLSRRIHGFKNTRNSHEKQQKFTNDEEIIIVSQIQTMLREQQRIPQKKQILRICERLLEQKFKDVEMSDSVREQCLKVGKNWIDRFLERHNAELMINNQVTLAEYYKNEFIERKRMRSDRVFMRAPGDNEMIQPDDPISHQPQLSLSVQQQQQTGPGGPSVPSVSHSEQYGYSEPYPQPPPPHLEWPLQKGYKEKTFNPYFTSVPQPQIPLQVPIAPLPQFGQGSLSQQQQQQQQPQQQHNASVSSSLSHFSFPSHNSITTATSNSNPGSIDQDIPGDPLDSCFSHGRLQYDLARALVNKELQKEEIDRSLLSRLVNNALIQAERDLVDVNNASHSVSVAQHGTAPHYIHHSSSQTQMLPPSSTSAQGSQSHAQAQAQSQQPAQAQAQSEAQSQAQPQAPSHSHHHHQQQQQQGVQASPPSQQHRQSQQPQSQYIQTTTSGGYLPHGVPAQQQQQQQQPQSSAPSSTAPNGGAYNISLY